MVLCHFKHYLKRSERFNLDFKHYFKGQKGSIWPKISETVHAMTDVCMKHIHKVVDDLSVYLMKGYFDDL